MIVWHSSKLMGHTIFYVWWWNFDVMWTIQYVSIYHMIDNKVETLNLTLVFTRKQRFFFGSKYVIKFSIHISKDIDHFTPPIQANFENFLIGCVWSLTYHVGYAMGLKANKWPLLVSNWHPYYNYRGDFLYLRIHKKP